MFKSLCFIAILFLLSCSTTTYYVVRHAEKENSANMTTDVPLSAAGKKRADALKDLLGNEKISHIYSTSFNRTKSTAAPLADQKGITIEIYDPNDTGFISKLRSRNEGNVLIVGHSNTVNDLVNRLAGEVLIPADLPESAYGDLFIVKRRGAKYKFEKKHFGL